MISEQKRYSAGYNQVWVYMEGRREADLQGVLYHPGLDAAWRFEGLVKLMQRCEQIYNALDYPSPAYRLRNIRAKRETEGKELGDLKEEAVEFDPQGQEKPTFIIRVQYRQNASWQGSVQWVERGMKRNFRSTLELIKLMDEAISDGEDDASWD